MTTKEKLDKIQILSKKIDGSLSEISALNARLERIANPDLLICYNSLARELGVSPETLRIYVGMGCARSKNEAESILSKQKAELETILNGVPTHQTF